MKIFISDLDRIGAILVAALVMWAFGPGVVSAQTALPFFTDFSEGIPDGWERQMTDSLRWEPIDTFGVVDSGALVADLSNTWEPDTTWLRTEPFDLQTAPSPVLRMTFALVNNNFIAPALSLWVETREGDWQRVVAWGQQFGVDSTISVEKSDDHRLPLSRENLHMVEITYSLDNLSSRTDVRFELRAEMMNGGWIVLDNFAIEDGEDSGVAEEEVGRELDLE